MADDTFYAWSPIRVGVGEEIKDIKPGDKVTASDLETDGEGFMAFVDSGAVRPYPYPDMPDTANQVSPIDFLRSKALENIKSEEDRILVSLSPEIAQASQGPISTAPPMIEGTEEAAGPPTEETPKKK
jgi:hypothetical protein